MAGEDPRLRWTVRAASVRSRGAPHFIAGRQRRPELRTPDCGTRCRLSDELDYGASIARIALSCAALKSTA